MRSSIESVVFRVYRLKDMLKARKSYSEELKQDLNYQLGQAIAHLNNCVGFLEEAGKAKPR